VNRDFGALTALYQRMGFIPLEEDTQPIVVALEGALPDVLNAPFPFSLPPYYIALIRCLGVLEGLAIQVEPEFRIISDAYPYISSRLLTDDSPELQSALQQLLFKEGRARWDRLEQLLDQANDTKDYDATVAVDKLISYLLSPAGAAIREQLVSEIIEGADELGNEALGLLERALIAQRLPGPDDLSSPRLTTANKIARAVTSALASPQGADLEKVLPIIQRISTEPTSRQAGVDIAAAVSERAISRGIRRLFALPDDGLAELD